MIGIESFGIHQKKSNFPEILLSWVDWDIFKRMKGVSLHSIWHLRVHSFVYFTFSDDYPYTCKCETWHRFMLSCWAFLCFPATWKTVELNHDLREIADANQLIICNLWAFVSIILRYHSERAKSLAIASDLTPYCRESGFWVGTGRVKVF